MTSASTRKAETYSWCISSRRNGSPRSAGGARWVTLVSEASHDIADISFHFAVCGCEAQLVCRQQPLPWNRDGHIVDCRRTQHRLRAAPFCSTAGATGTVTAAQRYARRTTGCDLRAICRRSGIVLENRRRESSDASGGPGRHDWPGASYLSATGNTGNAECLKESISRS